MYRDTEQAYLSKDGKSWTLDVYQVGALWVVDYWLPSEPNNGKEVNARRRTEAIEKAKRAIEST